MALATPDKQQALWQALAAQRDKCSSVTLRQRFAAQPERATQFSAELGPLFVDYSKHHLDTEIHQKLIALAENADIHSKLAALRAGEACNNTEQRSANYAALRGWATAESSDDKGIDAMYRHMAELVASVRSGGRRSCTGKRYSHIVNIGIGGSDFGPRLFSEALNESHQSAFHCHFLANIDPSCTHNTLRELPADSTLFIIASKSFGTQETLANAAAAQQWLREQLPGQDINQQFVAITAKPESAIALGVPSPQVLAVPDWVGGRFSVWSGFGLIVAINYGWDCFLDILRGGYEVDQHMRDSSSADMLPLTLALLDIWYRNCWGLNSQAILPYCHRLKELPDYLQQLFMESAGKSVDRHGKPLTVRSGGVIWGSEGTNGQHSFHQLLHQGSDIIPCDFITALRAPNPIGEQQQALLANCFAQSLALMQGKTAEEIADGSPDLQAKTLAHHKAMPGNRPSTTIVMDELNARSLGCLLALYEYRLICTSLIWDINPFDQWGVELGKQISRELLQALDDDSQTPAVDSSTAQLLARSRQALK